MDDQDQRTCALCGEIISEKARDFCRANAGRFNGQVFCSEHQRLFGNALATGWAWFALTMPGL